MFWLNSTRTLISHVFNMEMFIFFIKNKKKIKRERNTLDHWKNMWNFNFQQMKKKINLEFFFPKILFQLSHQALENFAVFKTCSL